MKIRGAPLIWLRNNHIKILKGGRTMKNYQPCEVKIRAFDTDDVVRTSQTRLVDDCFTDEEWYKNGGEES